MKSKKFILILIGILVVVGMLGFIFFSSTHTTSNTTTAASDPNAPAIPVKDYAPSLPMSQKTTILIQTSDSSDIKYIVPTGEVNTYIKNLPEGYKVVSKTP